MHANAQQILINGTAHAIPLPDGLVHTVCTSPPYYSLRQYAGAQEVDWPGVLYHPMPGVPLVRIPPMRCPLGLEPTPEAYIGHLVACFREVRRVMRADAVAWVVMGDSYGGGQGGNSTHSAKQRSNRGTQIEPTRGDNPGSLLMIPHRLALALQADGWLVRNDVVWHKVAPMPESVSGWRWERCRVKVKAGRPPIQPAHIPDDGRRPGGNRGNQWGDVQNQPNATWSPCPGCDKCRDTGGYVLRRGSWRHTRAHETVLMLAKGMQYYADQERVREALAESSVDRMNQATFHQQQGGSKDYQFGVNPNRSARQVLENLEQSRNGRNPRDVVTADELDELWQMFLAWLQDDNPRSVLTPSPESYKGAHYAVYPRSLIGPLLRATAPVRVCPVCGAPWCPVVERSNPVDRPDNPNPALPYTAASGHTNATGATTLHKVVSSTILTHRPTCDHDHRHSFATDIPVERCQKCGGPCQFTDEAKAGWCSIPGWVLDPFAGTFTTGAVCAELGVNCVGLDISAEYLDDHAKPRVGLTPSGALDQLPLFAERSEP